MKSSGRRTSQILLMLKPFLRREGVFPMPWQERRCGWFPGTSLQPETTRCSASPVDPGHHNHVLFVIRVSPLGEEALPPGACFGRHLFRVSFFPVTASSSSLTSRLPAGSLVCSATPPLARRGGEEKPLLCITNSKGHYSIVPCGRMCEDYCGKLVFILKP